MFFLRDLTENELAVPGYDYYGYYGHKKNPTSMYEAVLTKEYAQWSYGKRVSNAIGSEVQQCRNEIAMFDLSSFGKVSIFLCHIS